MSITATERAKHTPGPWALDSNGPGHEVVLARGGRHAVAAVQGTDDHQENLANGHLMAAAPDLLVALKRAVETIRAWHNMGHYAGEAERVWALYQESPEMAAINAAIAKAEGR